MSKHESMFSIVATLAIGILGSTVLPIPYAFARTGLFAGSLTMLVVAFVNYASCFMLIDACHATNIFTFEELSQWAMGTRFKTFTSFSLILLLFGTTAGSLAFISDVTQVLVVKAVQGSSLSGHNVFSWLLNYLGRDGRPLMVLTTLTCLLPLCLQRRIIDSDKAATAGLVVVLALVVVIVSRAIRSDFPAIRNGDLDIFAIDKFDKFLPESFAVIGFAFYTQPMLLPLLNELNSRGNEGVAIAKKATSIVLFGIALGVYWSVGVFGACLFGSNTQPNILLNEHLVDGPAAVVLYVSLLFYLSLAQVSTVFALRNSVELLLFGPGQPFTWKRHVTLVLSLLSGAVLVALLFPSRAIKIFAFTGSTAVCSVCYVIPVVIHLQVERRKRKGLLVGVVHEAGYRERMDDELPFTGRDVGNEADVSVGGLSPSNSLLRPLIKRDSAGSSSESLTAAPSLPLPMAAPSPSRLQRQASRAGAVLAGERASCGSLHPSQWIIPLTVLVVGVGCSAAGLYVATLDALGLL
jgi:sodium-coupled neutral amino acid transporter 11